MGGKQREFSCMVEMEPGGRQPLRSEHHYAICFGSSNPRSRPIAKNTCESPRGGLLRRETPDTAVAVEVT